MKVRENQKYNAADNFLYSNSYSCKQKNYGFDHFRKRHNQIIGTFEEVLGGRTINLVPALES